MLFLASPLMIRAPERMVVYLARGERRQSMITFAGVHAQRLIDQLTSRVKYILSSTS